MFCSQVSQYFVSPTIFRGINQSNDTPKKIVKQILKTVLEMLCRTTKHFFYFVFKVLQWIDLSLHPRISPVILLPRFAHYFPEELLQGVLSKIDQKTYL